MTHLPVHRACSALIGMGVIAGTGLRVHRVAVTLQAAGVPAETLILEITETAIAEGS